MSGGSNQPEAKQGLDVKALLIAVLDVIQQLLRGTEMAITWFSRQYNWGRDQLSRFARFSAPYFRTLKDNIVAAALVIWGISIIGAFLPSALMVVGAGAALSFVDSALGWAITALLFVVGITIALNYLFPAKANAMAGGNYQILNNGEGANNDPENNHKKDVEMKPVNSTEKELQRNNEALTKRVQTLEVLTNTLVSLMKAHKIDSAAVDGVDPAQLQKYLESRGIDINSMLKECKPDVKSHSRTSSTGSNPSAMYGGSNNNNKDTRRNVASEDDLRDGQQGRKENEGSSSAYSPGNTSDSEPSPS